MSNLVLKTKQFHSFYDFMREVISLTKAGKEVDMTKTLVQYGRLYYLKYWDSVDIEQANQEDEVSVQEAAVEEASQEDTIEVDLSKLSVAELRKMCDDKQIKHHPASKEAKLIELLTAK